MPDHRLLVGLLGQRFGPRLQPSEVERLGRPELDLARPGGGPDETAIDHGGECADARGEQRLAAIEVHGTPKKRRIGSLNKLKCRASHAAAPARAVARSI
jgi:hypothetical protein